MHALRVRSSGGSSARSVSVGRIPLQLRPVRASPQLPPKTPLAQSHRRAEYNPTYASGGPMVGRTMDDLLQRIDSAGESPVPHTAWLNPTTPNRVLVRLRFDFDAHPAYPAR